MAPLVSHEWLTLFYIDALGRGDRRAFEKHLPHCAPCRTGLVELDETNALIERESRSIDGSGVEPPRALLPRILAGAENEPQDPTALRRSLPQLLHWLRVATSLALVFLAVWSVSLRASLDRARSAQKSQGVALSLLASKSTRRYVLRGADGVLAIDRRGQAFLLVKQLRRAPQGHRYEARLIRDGRASPAAAFAGGSAISIVPLTRRVPASAVVAVSLERSKDIGKPHGRLLFAASAP